MHKGQLVIPQRETGVLQEGGMFAGEPTCGVCRHMQTQTHTHTFTHTQAMDRKKFPYTQGAEGTHITTRDQALFNLKLRQHRIVYQHNKGSHCAGQTRPEWALVQ